MLGDVDKAGLIKASIGERSFPHAGHSGKCQKLLALPGGRSLVNQIWALSSLTLMSSRDDNLGRELPVQLYICWVPSSNMACRGFFLIVRSRTIVLLLLTMVFIYHTST